MENLSAASNTGKLPPVFIVDINSRKSYQWEVRGNGRCYARCPGEKEAQRICDALNATCDSGGAA